MLIKMDDPLKSFDEHFENVFIDLAGLKNESMEEFMLNEDYSLPESSLTPSFGDSFMKYECSNNDGNPYPMVNPNDFLNNVDVDVENDNISYLTERSTPSPTSSGSSNYVPYTISGNNSDSSGSQDTYAVSQPNMNFNYIPTMTNNVAAVHTIPTVGANKNVKIKPKPLPQQQQSTNKTKKTGFTNQQSHTIVLPIKDYHNLIKKCTISNNSKTSEHIIVRTVQKKVMPPNSIGSVNNSNNKLDQSDAQTCSITALDDKALKKRQRMLRNRESASLSRKKKKEYVMDLEEKLATLVKENTDLKVENSKLREQISNISQYCHCQKRKFNLNGLEILNKRKNTMVMLAMCFMISFNLGMLNNFFTTSSPEAQLFSVSEEKLQPIGRRLLWMDTNFTDNYSEMNQTTTSTTKDKKYPICPLPTNQTENIRLATELRRWIGTNQNLTSNHTSDDPSSPFEFYSDFFTGKLNENSIYEDTKNQNSVKKRKELIEKVSILNRRKLLKGAKNHLQIFTPNKRANKYERLFKEIKRRDDTFYVLSFNTDNILLPASSHNKTTRPRMSFMLPAGDPFLNGQIALMQIDCEVLNTSIVHLQEKHIPNHLRTYAKYSGPNKNVTMNQYKIKEKPLVDLDLEYKKKNFQNMPKPFFMEKTFGPRKFINPDGIGQENFLP